MDLQRGAEGYQGGHADLQRGTPSNGLRVDVGVVLG